MTDRPLPPVPAVTAIRFDDVDDLIRNVLLDGTVVDRSLVVVPTRDVVEKPRSWISAGVPDERSVGGDSEFLRAQHLQHGEFLVVLGTRSSGENEQ